MNIYDSPIKHYAALVQAHTILASVEPKNSEHFKQIKENLSSLIKEVGGEKEARKVLASVPEFQAKIIASSLKEEAEIFSPYKNKSKKYLHKQLLNNGYKAKKIGGATHYTMKEGDKLHHVIVNHKDNTGEPEATYQIHKRNGLGSHVLHSKQFGAQHSANEVLHHISKGKGLIPKLTKNVRGNTYYNNDHAKIHDHLQGRGFQQKQIRSGLFGQHKWTQHTKIENGVKHTINIPHHKGGHVEYTRNSIDQPYKIKTKDFHPHRTSMEINHHIDKKMGSPQEALNGPAKIGNNGIPMHEEERKQSNGPALRQAPNATPPIKTPSHGEPRQEVKPDNVVNFKPKTHPQQMKPIKKPTDEQHAQLAKHLQNSGYSPEYHTEGPHHTTYTKHNTINNTTHQVHLNRDNSTLYKKSGAKGEEQQHFAPGTDYAKIYQHAAQRGGV